MPEGECEMDANFIFKQGNTVAGISAVSKEHELHDSPKRLSLDEWGRGTGILFEPCTGFHFGVCGPLAVTHEIISTCRFERPVVVFMLILSGEFCMTNSGNVAKEVNLSSNMFMVGEVSGIASIIHIPVQENYNHIGMLIESEYISSVFGESSYQHLKTLLRGQESVECEEAFPGIRHGIATQECIQSVKKLMQNNFDSSDIFFRHSILNLFINILRCIEQNPVEQGLCLMENDVDTLIKIKVHIEKKYLEIDSIHCLCEKYAMNRIKMHNGFKQLFNITIAKYIHKCKMEHAYTLLSERRLNVSQSAFEIGYSNIGHFISAYKRVFGETPKQTMRRAAA